MPAELTVEPAQFADRLARMGDATQIDDWTVALKRLAVMVRAATLENFASGHAPDGTPWEPLKRPRANSKGGDKPLRDRGLLMASVTGQGGGHVEQITQSTLTFGANLEYAGVHNYGHTFDVPAKQRGADDPPWVFRGDGGMVFTRRVKAHKVKVPQRQFLGWSQKMAVDAARIVEDFVIEALASNQVRKS